MMIRLKNLKDQLVRFKKVKIILHLNTEEREGEQEAICISHQVVYPVAFAVHCVIRMEGMTVI